MTQCRAIAAVLVRTDILVSALVEEPIMELTMPRKHATSFRLSTSTLVLLKQLAESENRSITNMVEKLIIDRANKEGITK